MGFWSGYRGSLKAIEVEELLDLLLYRPPAYFLAHVLTPTPVTPNGVTLAAGCVGVAAGLLLARNDAAPFWVPPALLILYNILDCADGMLARMQGSGSRLGRLLDGIADYAVMAALFAGIGLSLSSATQSLLGTWLLTVAAATTTTVHAVLLDFYRNRFLDHLLPRRGILTDDLEEFRRELDLLGRKRGDWGRKGVLWIYVGYSSIQRRLTSERGTLPPATERITPDNSYPERNRSVMRGWTFIGPTTSLSVLLAGLLAQQIELALWAILIPANLLALSLFFLQRRIDRRHADHLRQSGEPPL